MKTIAILRHGEAEFGADYDAGRELTDIGIQDCCAAAKTLDDQFSKIGGIEAIFYSPFVRTQQTADTVIDALAAFDSRPIHVSANKALLGDNTPLAVCQWLDTLPYERIVLISHQPLVSCLVDWLVQGVDSFKLGGANNFPFYPSSLAILSAEVPGQGCAELLSLTHHYSR